MRMEKVVTSLDTMLLTLARANRISTFNLAIFKHWRNGYREPDLWDEAVVRTFPLRTEELVARVKTLRESTESRGELLGVTSEVVARGKKRHMQLLDLDHERCYTGAGWFRAGTPRDVLKDYADFFQRFGASAGFLVNSGRSFHFYGSGVTTEAQWMDQLHRISADRTEGNPVDKEWLETQLERGYSLLRISKNDYKKTEPVVEKSVGLKLARA